jgi:hypothetical protein
MANRKAKKSIKFDPEWQSVIKRNYATACFSLNNWLYLADDLIECATILESRVEETFIRARARARGVSQGPLAVHFMLIAYAVENLLKAAQVRANRFRYEQEFKEHEQMPKELKTHDLVSLAKMVGLKVDLQSEDLLRRLEQCAVWRGRYPVPTAYPEFSGSAVFSDGKQYKVTWFGGKDVERLKNLIEAIRTELNLHTLRSRLTRKKIERS